MASILRVNTLTDASSNNSVALATVSQGTTKTWVNYDAVDQATRGSLNQSSLTDNSTGDFTSAHSNNFNSAEDKCVMGTVWNTQNEGSSEYGGAERGFHGIHQAGDTSSITSSIRINSRIGATDTADGADTDFDGTYCALLGDLA